jgi:ABC-type Co2+ transport system permease subunit
VLVGLCVALIDGYFTYSLTHNFTDPPSVKEFLTAFVGGLIGIGVVPILFGAIAYYFATKLIVRSTAPVAWRFFQMQMSAWSGRKNWIEFKKKIDAATKK